MKKRTTTFATPLAIRNAVIGSHHTLRGPFGSRTLVYADSTASGKALSFIEDYIRDIVLPYYANTHTETSATGLQTTSFREEARNLIRKALNAPKDEYAVIFTGSGCTGAINKLAHVLGVSQLSPKVEEPSRRAVVFISCQEHHSNELIWRESKNVDLVVIPQNPVTGTMDYQKLEDELCKHQDRDLKLGSFSAASNVTGIRIDTETVSRLLHKYGALAFWDFAAAGPHVKIDLKGQDLDGIYLSPHKFVGGPGTPGLLVARRVFFHNRVPDVPGGGTVFYVQPHAHDYIKDVETREEGGTPAIIESIRAGLVLQLHNQISGEWIEKKEDAILERALSVWSKNPNLVILGNPEAKRVPIVSFLVKSPTSSNAFLHHNFVVALLNDLFGLQTRGGCSCAGPYGHMLLRMDDALSDEIVKELEAIGEALRPGWTRLGFSYYMSDEVVDFIITAVDLVAQQGYKMLPQYHLNLKSGVWTHVDSANSRPMSLWDLTGPYSKPKPVSNKDLQGTLAKAHKMLGSQSSPSLETIAKAFSLEGQASRSMQFVVSKDETMRSLLSSQLKSSLMKTHKPLTIAPLASPKRNDQKNRFMWLRKKFVLSS